jgi:hypothetical protein
MVKLYSINKITYKDTKPFILNIHYARRMPSISFAYGLFNHDELVGVVTYGSPASPPLCRGVAGEQNKHLVLELNRLVLKYNLPNEASRLVGASLKMLPRPRIIVSYADTAQDHNGTVYQACNFLFTGTSKPRTDINAGGKHPRHHLGDKTKRIYRSAKHRYLFLIGSKKEKKKLMSDLKYQIKEYPEQ